MYTLIEAISIEKFRGPDKPRDFALISFEFLSSGVTLENRIKTDNRYFRNLNYIDLLTRNCFFDKQAEKLSARFGNVI